MANRLRRLEAEVRRVERALLEIGNDLHEARLTTALQLDDVGAAIGQSRTAVWRREQGQASEALLVLARHASAVGLRLHIRLYPNGAPIRDEAQLALLRLLQARIGPAWQWKIEAPLLVPGDLRAFDAVLTRGASTVAVEAITRLRDVQAQARRAHLKQRDGSVECLILLISGTHANRNALREARGLLRSEFPLDTRACLASLKVGREPPASGIVLL